MCDRQTTKKYTVRNSPPYPANKCPEGQTRKGNDGKMYKAVANSKGVKRWVLSSPKKASAKSPIKKASAKSSGYRWKGKPWPYDTDPKVFLDNWKASAKKGATALTYARVQKVRNNKKLGDSIFVLEPQTYVTMTPLSSMNLDDFDEYGGKAVLGSGADKVYVVTPALVRKYSSGSKKSPKKKSAPKSPKKKASAKKKRVYVDNARNRKLGRVGKTY